MDNKKRAIRLLRSKKVQDQILHEQKKREEEEKKKKQEEMNQRKREEEEKRQQMESERKKEDAAAALKAAKCKVMSNSCVFQCLNFRFHSFLKETIVGRV